MTASNLYCGDIVQLRSGGAQMVVIRVDHTDEVEDTEVGPWVDCMWMDASMRVNKGRFPKRALKAFPETAGPYSLGHQVEVKRK